MLIDILFQSISSLTGGLITDITTAMVGLLCLSFLAMGLDLLFSLVSNTVGRNHLSGAVLRANDELQQARNSGSQVKIDMARARYRSALNKYGQGLNR